MKASEVCRALGISRIRLLLLLEDGTLQISDESVEEYIARALPESVA